MDKVMDGGLLNNIAFDLIKEKAVTDKLEEAKNEQKKEEEYVEYSKNSKKVPQETEEDLLDLDEPDSEEERIMQKELAKRTDFIKEIEEDRKEKSKRKYGDYKEIIETEFLDTMLKNDLVVCHFYHNSFERCKIMDKHLRIIAESHHDTLFVKINAEKTPFFVTKLSIQVNYLNYFIKIFLDSTYYNFLC
jgi:hypothetical protein